MRANRLVSIVLLLQKYTRLSARELATRLEVSERTIYRDMEALSAAGIPVVAERGSSGGLSLIEGYRTSLTGLNESEIQTLFIGQPERLLGDLGLKDTYETALLKLLNMLPKAYHPEYLRQRIHVDVSGWRESHEPLHALPPLQEAVWAERQIKITYRRGDDTTVTRIAHPLGLVAKGSVWYLVAVVDDTPRTYRVARVAAVEILPQVATRPADFDLPAFWSQSKTDFVAKLPQYTVRVRASAQILPRLRYSGWFVRVQSIAEPAADGWSEVVLAFDTEDEACRYVLGMGAQVDVREPSDLRTRILELARELVAFYTTT